MAVGKNKKLGKARKGSKRKVTDPFSKKEWYDVRAPSVFPTKTIGKTIVTKTTGTKVARDGLLGRLFEVSLGDLKPDGEDEAFRKFLLKVEEVNGMNCLTQFHGMDLTTDKLRSLVRKGKLSLRPTPMLKLLMVILSVCSVSVSLRKETIRTVRRHTLSPLRSDKYVRKWSILWRGKPTVSIWTVSLRN